MNKEIFVQNVKMLCLQKKLKPTNACKESGVGGSFINDIERGRVPSVDRVQMLAKYLGVTTSELLGENTKPATHESDGLTDQELDLITAYRKADDRAKQVVELTLAPWTPPVRSDEAM